MSIVLNEYAWAVDAIRDKQLGRKPSETLLRIAKYYLYEGMSKKETRVALERFLIECDPNAAIVKWSDSLDKIMKYAQKYHLVMIDDVGITKNEIDTIRAVRGVQLQRLAFTLLCIAKYNRMVSSDNTGWVNTPRKEIMNMSNINTSIKRRSEMFGQLKDAGLIRFSKKIDNLSVQVLFVDTENAGVELPVKDFRNLGYQYMKYCGEPFFVCECCGITEKISDPVKGMKKKYCAECAAKVHMRQQVNSVMRHRNANKLNC